MTIRVLINGARGKMGQETVKAITDAAGLALVAQANRQDDLTQLIHTSKAQVVVDFTTASAAFENAAKIIDAGVHPVIGTSGLTAEQLQLLAQRCQQKKLGGIVAPNFALGAVLMMKYARDCAHYFPDAEIIEMHHSNKADAPSGTAIYSAEMIAKSREKPTVNTVAEEKIAGVRGGRYQDVTIHSVRLPGLIAHQKIIFGGLGQTLSIQHDTYSREAFMPGVCLACHKVVALQELVYGLEHAL